MSTETTTDLWQFLELPNERAGNTQALFCWGMNCDAKGNPWLLFLDLIGWSEDELGEISQPSGSSYGYVELGYLAEALNEYADDPHAVRAWVDEVMRKA